MGATTFMRAQTRTRRICSAIAAGALVAGVMIPTVGVPAAANATGDVIVPAVPGGFQIDGNVDPAVFNGTNQPGSIDWTNVNSPTPPYFQDPSGNLDTTVYDQGSKEDTPVEQWTSAGSAGAPPKGDLGNLYYYAKIYMVNGQPRVYFFIGYERDFASGSVTLAIELNQLANKTILDSKGNPLSVPNRTNGDIRIRLSETGSGGLQIAASYDVWTNGAWVDKGTLGGNIVGRLNDGTITDPYDSDFTENGQLTEEKLIEFAVDMTGAGIVPPDCPTPVYFGTINIRDRASPSLSSQLKDFMSAPIYTPSICENLKIEKRDAAGNLIPGATFTVTPNPNTGSGTLTVTDGGANDKTTTGAQAPADGIIEFPQAKPTGNITVTETVPPPGYIGTTAPITKNCPTGNVDATPCVFTFVNQLGSLVFHKQDDKGNPLGGATFTLTATGGAAAGAPWELDANPITIVDCVGDCANVRDKNPAPGEFQVLGLPTGTYNLVETAAPANYNLDPDTVAVTISSTTPFEVTAPFVDPRKVGWIQITKKLVLPDGTTPWTPTSLSILDGTTFVVYTDANGDGVRAADGSEDARLYTTGAVATCTVTGGTGNCVVGPLATGTYRIAETVAPPNSDSLGDVNVTVVEGTVSTPVAVDYVNKLQPLDINLAKTGPATANVGDTVTYTFDVTNIGPRLHAITVVDVTNLCAGGAEPVYVSGDANEIGYLEQGETWRYTCTHVVTMSDPDHLINEASVTGTDDYGRTDSATDTHEIDIIYPDVTVVKTGNGPISSGDAAVFTITVTVGGETGSIARAVSLHDDLPGGLAWSLVAPVTGCAMTDADTLDCAFGDLAFGATRTVQVTAVTPARMCAALPNTVTVAATNEGPTATLPNTSTASIAVNCPDVAVVKTADSAIVDAGGSLVFTMTVSNEGLGTAKNVVLTDTLPAGIVWTTSTAGCSIAGGVLTCEFGDIAAGAPDKIVTVSGATDTADCGPVVNIASVAADNEPLTAATNNVSTATALIRCPLGIEIIKDGPTQAHVGDEITYTFDVVNSGFIPLVTVVLTDVLCDAGTIELILDGTGDAILAVGETWTYECTRVIQAGDPDPLPNTASVLGTADDGRTTTSTDSHEVDIIHPAVQIVKTASDDEITVGEQVTYTYVVTNTGDVTLTDVVVTDDILGPIGTIPSLAAGATATLTRTITAGAAQVGLVVNVGTVVGTDPTGRRVTDDDDATVRILATRPSTCQERGDCPKPPLPVTGAQIGTLLTVSINLVLLGGLVLLAGRNSRRRREGIA